MKVSFKLLKVNLYKNIITNKNVELDCAMHW